MASILAPRTEVPEDAERKKLHYKNRKSRHKNRECEGLIDFFTEMSGGGVDLEEREWRVLSRDESSPGIPWDELPSQCCPTIGQAGMRWSPLPQQSDEGSPTEKKTVLDAGIAARKTLKRAQQHTLVVTRKSKKTARRLVRKRIEVDSFFSILKPLLCVLEQQQLSATLSATEAAPLTSSSLLEPCQKRALRVVDFASGSGALVLPLAAAMPLTEFTAVDMNPVSCRLLEQRVAEAGLNNVVVVCSLIETFENSTPQFPIDVVLGLHACGNATDFILEQALILNAAYIFSPCCIGKMLPSETVSRSSAAVTSSSLGNVGKDMLQISHPRSTWLASSLKEFCEKKRAGDIYSVLEGMRGGEGPQNAGSLADMQSVEAEDNAEATVSTEVLLKSIVRLADISELETSGETSSKVSSATGTAADTGASSNTKGTLKQKKEELVVYPRRRFAARLCKCAVELDRNHRAQEVKGYGTLQLKLLDHAIEPQPKNDLLVGLPGTIDLAEFQKLLHTEPLMATSLPTGCRMFAHELVGENNGSTL